MFLSFLKEFFQWELWTFLGRGLRKFRNLRRNKALSAVKIGKAIGPDCIPNRVLKEFAHELAPVVKDIYNASLIEGYFPDALKASLLNPIPKISPPQRIESDLRPIALTCTLAKVL